MNRTAGLLAVWGIVLVVGFGAVIALGRPLPTSRDELAAAYQVSLPVTQDAALASAATIVRLQYPSLAGAQRTVSQASDFGEERIVIAYSDPKRQNQVRISVSTKTGRVTVSNLQ